MRRTARLFPLGAARPVRQYGSTYGVTGLRFRGATPPVQVPPSQSVTTPWSSRQTWVAVLLVGAGYYLAVVVGLALTFHPQPVAVLWPANAVLLAALLIAPEGAWPILLLAALPPHLIGELGG